MVGKSKDNKANKGRKALENEWELALAAANNNDRLIASSSNVETSKLLNTQQNVDNSGYIKHRVGASARERAKIFNSLSEKDEVDLTNNNDDIIIQKFANSIDITEDMDEEAKKKAILKAKKKAEKEAKLEFERKEKENLEKRREEKRKKDEELKKLLEDEQT